jgi:hypothetical protein
VTLTALVAMAAVGLADTAEASQGSNQFAALEKALFVRSDFPAGWTGQGKVSTSNTGGGGFPGQGQLASCLGVGQSLLNQHSPTATSPNFQDKRGTHYVQDNTNAFRSAKVANEELAAISGSKVPGCLTTDLQTPSTKQQLESSINGTVGTVTVTAVNPSALVHHASGFVIAFPATVQGSHANVTITVISMVRGNTGHQVEFTSVGTPFSASFEHHLVAVAYGRT